MRRTVLALVATTAILAACGDTTADTTESEPTGATEATTSTAPEGDGAPERIVSLSPSATEMLFAVGAGDQVVAVDSFSTYPAEAPVTDLSAYEPNLEAISTYEPDLVVVDGTNPDLVAGLEQLAIAVFEAPAPATLDELYVQMADLGAAAGHGDEAVALAEEMEADIAAVLAEVPERSEPLTYYHELDDLLYSITSDTFLGQLYALAGLENVADAADPDGASGGYPQLSAEHLVAADPDLVFLADTKCCGQTVETFAARPGFSGLHAVAAGQVVLLDDDVASRWGPRIVDLLEQIVEAVVAADAATAEEAAAA
jgi:iron complex transport system substrate-binding protein